MIEHVPVISVVMPVYNSGRFLQEAIDSILCQTFTDFELIIVDDGSDDASKQILKRYADPRIRILTNEKNQGLVYSLNRGLLAARGEFIARFDADDLSLPNRFATQLEYLRSNPGIAACSSFIELIDIYGNPKGEWPEDRSAITELEIAKTITRTNCLAHPAMMIRSSIMKKFIYRSEFRLAEDWGLWLEMLSAGYRIAKIQEVLLKYRIHPQSVTHQFNSTGPHKKIILFLSAYLRYRVSHFRMNNWDRRILLTWIASSIQYPWHSIIRPLLARVKRALERRPWRFLSVLNKLEVIPATTRVIFIFPYYHTGGAENVHCSIVESVTDANPVVLFTSKSSDDGYKERFLKAAHCIELSDFADFPLLKKVLIKRLAGRVNELSQVTVFSSNSQFFYNLLPELKPSVSKSDLIHAFVDELEDGPEKWSLPYVDLLDARVFVSMQAKQQMMEWYDRFDVANLNKSRLHFIRNYTEIPPELPVKQPIPPLQVVYIGRAGFEKRVPLLLKVAAHFRNDSQIRFTFIGDVEKLVPEDLKSFVDLPGMLKPGAVNKFLESAHVLLLGSSREGMPMVIFEAMAHGVVPLSTAVGDVPEYVRNGETGYLLPVHPESELVRCLIELLERLKNDPDSVSVLSRNVYELACREFDRTAFSMAYRKILLS